MINKRAPLKNPLIHGLGLSNQFIRVEVDKQTGNIISLKKSGIKTKQSAA